MSKRGMNLRACLALGAAMVTLRGARTYVAGMCLALAMATPAVAQQSATAWRAEVVTSELNYPWSLQRSGTTLIVTEAAGNVVMVDGARLRRFRLQTSQPILREGGSGLLGMALSADFERSGTAYLYHTYRTVRAWPTR